MSHKLLASGIACTFALTAVVAAQNPPAPMSPKTPTSQTSPRASADAMPAGMITVEGCILKEAEVPGRTPPEELKQQTTMDNDYVLTDTKTIKGTTPQPMGSKASTGRAVGTGGMTAGSQMYKVKELDKANFKSEYVGHRVQVDGALDHVDRSKNEKSFATDLVILRATAIRPVAGDCPKPVK